MLDRTYSPDGWMYSARLETLADDTLIETEEKLHHMYRRRRWFCSLVKDKNVNPADTQLVIFVGL